VPLAPPYFALFDSRRQLAVLYNAAARIAEQPAQPNNNSRHLILIPF
jgi:hypothetical protein